MPATLVRLDAKTYDKLKIRAMIEKRSMADIIREALAMSFELKPIERAKLKAIVKNVMTKDKAIIQALREL